MSQVPACPATPSAGPGRPPPSSRPTSTAGGTALSWGPGFLSRLSCHLPRRLALFSPSYPTPHCPCTITPTARTFPPPPQRMGTLPPGVCAAPCLVRVGAVSLHPKALLTPHTLSSRGSWLWSALSPFLRAQAWWPPGFKAPSEPSFHSDCLQPSPAHQPRPPVCSPSPRLVGVSAAFTAAPAPLWAPRPPCSGSFPLLHGCAAPLLSWLTFLHPSLHVGLLWGSAPGPKSRGLTW